METDKILDYVEQPLFGDKHQLVVLLHGYGSNKDDLISLIPELSVYLPNACFISPNAPQKFEGDISNAYQWFSLLDRSEEALLCGADWASKILIDFLYAKLGELGMGSHQLALIGFSQGAMLAMHCGLRMNPAPRALLCYSGTLIAPSLLTPHRQSNPKVMLVHGTNDEVVPFGQMYATARALRANLVPTTVHKCHGLGHGIDIDGINVGGRFLQSLF